MTKQSIFIISMSVFTGVVITGYVSLLGSGSSDLSPVIGLIRSLSLFDLFIVELVVFLAIGTILVRNPGLPRYILYGLSSLFIVIYCLQLGVFYHGREFLSRTALENYDHIYLFLDVSTLLLVAAVLLIAAAGPFAVEFWGKTGNKGVLGKGGLLPLLLVCLGLGIYLSEYWLPADVLEWREQYRKDYVLPRTAPVTALTATMSSFLFIPKTAEHKHPELSIYELNELEKLGFHYDSSSPYPLAKEHVYRERPVFQSGFTNGRKPNVIVLFLEGVSARVLGAYGSRYQGLTPHMDHFARDALVVENYFNHTAATYRGLHGQLCSFYPTYGGLGGWHTNISIIPDSGYLSLADLFKSHGYETIFLDSHHIDHQSSVDEMMRRLGFETILTGDRLAAAYLESAEPNLVQAYSDKQYFKSVVGFLQDREKSSQESEQRPFFMALYNYGTHAFLKQQVDRERYVPKRNIALDKFHTLDYAFGKFWSYLRESAFAENTIVILTSDHCHYQEKPYVEAFSGSDYQPLFVDRIPLIIRDPSRPFTKRIDARNSTSLDFTPTLVHYFALGNFPNPFMGSSILEKKNGTRRSLGVAAMGPDEIYLIDDDSVYRSYFADQYQMEAKIIEKFLRLISQLELTDALWDENGESR